MQLSFQNSNRLFYIIIFNVYLNVPIKDKVIRDDTRITLCLPFINRLIEKKAKIIIISHLGRPKGINERAQVLKR